jgi:signal recognition particle subunit SRP54
MVTLRPKNDEEFMFENLSERLERSFKILKGEGKITEINVAETLKDVRRALLDADVNYKVAKGFTDTVKQKALGMNVLTAVKPSQLMVKIVHDELTELMGGKAAELHLEHRPAVILMSGLQGSGKTTFSGKLANMLKSRQHKNPLLVACDVYRPAAIEQLKVVGEAVGVDVYTEEGNRDVVSIAQNAIRKAKTENYNVVIVDTAGRLAVDEEMMDEISRLKQAITPDETLFVVDSMTGQDAVNTAKEFNDRLDFDGVVLTKLDGDTRGGAALSIRTVVTKPIKFVGTGEKMEAIDVFHPARMADRILGMGDVVSLVERAQMQFDEEEARKLEKKIRKNKFDFDDFMSQIQQIKKMGNIKELASMIPGVGKQMKDLDIDDNAFKGIEAIIQSMTPKERANPDIINQSRRLRIARGSGTKMEDVNRLMKQFEQTRKMMKMVSGMDSSRMAQMAKAMKAMKGGMPKM